MFYDIRELGLFFCGWTIAKEILIASILNAIETLNPFGG